MPRRPATEAEIAALASGIRLRILRMTYHQPLTNREIARRLVRDPATALHHVRRLVAAGLLQAMPVRRGARGAREIPYRSTAWSWSLELEPERAGPALHEAMLEAFLGEAAEVGVERLEQTRLVLRLDEAQLAEFRDRLYGLLREFAGRAVDPRTEGLGVYLAMHPAALAGKPDADRDTMEEV
jgi:DNA-binding transcriptional ArsR family regulator